MRQRFEADMSETTVVGAGSLFIGLYNIQREQTDSAFLSYTSCNWQINWARLCHSSAFNKPCMFVDRSVKIGNITVKSYITWGPYRNIKWNRFNTTLFLRYGLDILCCVIRCSVLWDFMDLHAFIFSHSLSLGDQARNFFLQSGLPAPILAQIWYTIVL